MLCAPAAFDARPAALTEAARRFSVSLMLCARLPAPRLRPFVQMLWASRETGATGGRERVLPTGSAHLVFRFEAPLRTFAATDDVHGNEIGLTIFGGPRAEPYLRDSSRAVTSVGALLAPGAVALFAGDRADLLAHSHTPLDELWGRQTARLLEQLQEAGDPLTQLARFEALLLGKLPRTGGIHPAVAHAIARFETSPAIPEAQRVGLIVKETGYSHRHFDTLFREAVGIAPKRYLRLRRFQVALGAVTGSAPLAAVALAAGYSDQAHLTREFREFAGITPSEYRRRRPQNPRHVPEPE